MILSVAASIVDINSAEILKCYLKFNITLPQPHSQNTHIHGYAYNILSTFCKYTCHSIETLDKFVDIVENCDANISPRNNRIPLWCSILQIIWSIGPYDIHIPKLIHRRIKLASSDEEKLHLLYIIRILYETIKYITQILLIYHMSKLK